MVTALLNVAKTTASNIPKNDDMPHLHFISSLLGNEWLEDCLAKNQWRKKPTQKQYVLLCTKSRRNNDTNILIFLFNYISNEVCKGWKTVELVQIIWNLQQRWHEIIVL